jgi:hypothetical protein
VCHIWLFAFVITTSMHVAHLILGRFQPIWDQRLSNPFHHLALRRSDYSGMCHIWLFAFVITTSMHVAHLILVRFRPIWDQHLSNPFHHLAISSVLFSETPLASAAHIGWNLPSTISMFDFIFSHFSSLMSTPTTPSSSPHRDAAGSWKRKYALLEAQFAAASKEPNFTSKRQVAPAVVFHNTHRIISTSISAGQISLGRRLRRTVDLFHSARDLVEQNERCIGLEEDGEDINLSVE